MVGESGTMLVEVLHPITQSVDQSAEVIDRLATDRLHCADPIAIPFGGRIQGRIRTEGGNHPKGLPLLGELIVILQIILRGIRGADDLDVHATQKCSSREVRGGQLFIRLIKDGLGGLGGQGFADAEVPLQLHVRPQIDWATHSLFHGLGISHKFVPRVPVSGDQPFRNAIGPLQPPLIMVSIIVTIRQPSIDNIIEIGILIDFLGVQMAVIIHQRKILSYLMEQLPRQLRPEKKIIIQESHYKLLSRKQQVRHSNFRMPKILLYRPTDRRNSHTIGTHIYHESAYARLKRDGLDVAMICRNLP